MKRRSHVTIDESFTFLEYPAELRNAIYKLICNEPQLKLTHRSHYRRHEGALNYLRLAHVNQQLRQEFLPIYYDRIPSIRYCDASQFIRGFALPLHLIKILSTLTLDLDDSAEEVDGAADVLPLLNYIKTNTKINLKFHLQKDSQILHRLFQELTAPPDTPTQIKWDSYMQRYVKELRITPSATPHVGLVVKHAVNEYWMYDSWDRPAKRSWFRMSGFPYDGLFFQRSDDNT